MMPGGIAMLIMMPLAGQITNIVQPKYLIAFGLAGLLNADSLYATASRQPFGWKRTLTRQLVAPLRSISHATGLSRPRGQQLVTTLDGVATLGRFGQGFRRRPHGSPRRRLTRTAARSGSRT